MTYDVIIIGGGVAGGAAAIELARDGRRVLLLEKQSYPAHKLCGEFLSGESRHALRRLGVFDAVEAAGATSIRDAVVTAPDGARFEGHLPEPAVGLSRFVLDPLLLQAARDHGAEVRTDTLVRSVEGDLQRGFVVSAGGEEVAARVVIGAYGRRGLLDRKLDRPDALAKSPFVAFKAHYEGLDLSETIELHAFRGGYCGISPVEGGRVNVCWIAHERSLRIAGGDPEEMLERILGTNRVLAGRLREMERLSEDFVAVSQVNLARKDPFSRDVCMIGDAAAMIAPLCGDGMSMALASAAMASPLAARFLDGRLDEASFRSRYTKAWGHRFRPRLRLGKFIHHGFGHPVPAAIGVRACRIIPGLSRWVIRNTRG